MTLAVSCGKDPDYEQDDYIYRSNGFDRMENVNGILFEWNKNANITEEQKAVVMELLADMVKVEGDVFLMGAQNANDQGEQYDSEAREDESPVHAVTLDDYFIGKFEITQQQWRVIMGQDQRWSTMYGYGDRIPAYNISYFDAELFALQLSFMTGLVFDIPTEAQWEFAARGGKLSNHFRYSGSNDSDAVSWNIENCGNVLHNVGEKQPNELGLYDMSGSLWEWCADSYSPYSATACVNPLVESGTAKVLRGGAWTYLPAYGRVTCRDSYSPVDRSVANGFRVVLRVR